jgi:Na+-translocating ferredoxin:NAD+ oxidoreductase subunit D
VPNKSRLLLGSSPHANSGVNPRHVMLAVLLALLPVTINGIRLFGLPALGLIVTSVCSAVIWELLFQLATRQKPRIADCSALVTGLLVALIVPPSLPWWMAALGTLFGIVVAKEFFGGIGANPFNPALVGRAILLMSFPSAMTTWHKPFEPLVDASATATTLGIARQSATAITQAAPANDAVSGTMVEIMRSVGASSPGDLYRLLFIGNRAGSIGETSVLLILIGGIFLVGLRVIGPIIPLCVIGSTALFSQLLGVDPLFAVLSGGVVFGAVFMATDYSSSPMTTTGRYIYGVAIGLIIALIRRFGSYPEGVTYAILVMNAFAPFLDRIRTRKYGFVKKPRTKPAKGGAQ